jgi:hypothetical protein
MLPAQAGSNGHLIGRLLPVVVVAAALTWAHPAGAAAPPSLIDKAVTALATDPVYVDPQAE